MEAQSDMPIREERLLSHELSYTHLYAHFTRSAEDALQITIEKKLRTSLHQGRKDRIFAVNLSHTLRDDFIQLGSRQYGVLFSTPESGYEGEGKAEVYWHGSDRDEQGEFIPLDFVITFGPDEVITAQDVRAILDEKSPEWKD